MEHEDRPLRIKTCLSSFEQYCQENKKCQTQMHKLRQCFNTTITRYTKKVNHIPKKQQNSEKSLSSSRQFNSIRQGKNRNMLLPCFNPELIEVTKLKLHSNAKEPTRFKTQYTIHRHNFKNYLKLKKNVQFATSHHNILNKSQQNKKAEKPKYRYNTQYEQPQNIQEIDVCLDYKYKRSKTNPHQNNIDLQHFLQQQSLRKTVKERKNKVIFSSKQHISIKKDRNQSVQVTYKSIMKPRDNLTGWQTHYLQDDFHNISAQASPFSTLKPK